MASMEGPCCQSQFIPQFSILNNRLRISPKLSGRTTIIKRVVKSLIYRYVRILLMEPNNTEQIPAIDFSEKKARFDRKESNLADTINEADFRSISYADRKSSEAKKIRTTTKSEEEIKMEKLVVLHTFHVSVKLINLLRDPLFNNHKFEQQFLINIQTALQGTGCDGSPECAEMSLYIHLMLAQVQNLEEMEELGKEAASIVRLNTEKWNSTNIINAKCILINLSRLKSPKQLKEPQNYNLTVQVLQNMNGYFVEDGIIRISKNYIKLAMQNQGHLDVYFGPFLLNKFTFEANLWFTLFKHNQTAIDKYANIYKQIAKEAAEFAHIDFEQWYHEQVNKIVNNQFFTEDLVTVLNHTKYNPWVEKLLIGLQGWKGLTDAAIRLLNVYYDNCDWQITSEFNPVINVTGDPFALNYLIDNPKGHHQSLVYCLNAPCFDESIRIEVFSWHIPKLVEYTYDQISYVWAQQDFGLFPRSGFYNFALFNLFDHGKEAVNKILDVAVKKLPEQQQPTQKSVEGTPVLNVRSVKGRMIVQPPNTRDLSLHQIIIDSLTSEQGLYKTASFEDVIKEIQKYQEMEINTVYLSGVFERDNEPTAEVFRKPNASPLAITNRTIACKMLGGDEGLKKVIEKAHSIGVKIIVDITTRVCSSRMSKRYNNVRLRAVDEHGRLVYHYGANGRSLNYDDTTSLNYRKKQAWDITLDEAIEIIDKFNIDGFYMDNGYDWPSIYKMNEEELFRRENPNDPRVYSDEEIFEGVIVVPSKIAGFWASPLHILYPNPFVIKFCKKLWEKNPNLLLISETLDIPDHNPRLVTIIRSGPIPRSFQLPKALSQIAGHYLSSSGSISQVQPKHVSSLKKWYESFTKLLPKGTVLINSTTSPIWPYLAYIFKRSTWAIIDLMFLMPALTMTTGNQLYGRGYKSKTASINYIPVDSDRKESKDIPAQKNQMFDRTHSLFFQEEYTKTKRGSVVHCFNSLAKDPSQIKYLEQSLRKDVRESGFDLADIYKHYSHRRQLRKSMKVLKEGNLMLITAEHIYGIHNNVLSFVRYDQNEILLISINFNSNGIDMHYNLSALKSLFKKYDHSDKVLKLESVLNPERFKDEYYIISELVAAKIELHIPAYNTRIWKLTIQNDNKIEEAIQCSAVRMKEKLSRQPPAWIYSSVFFNQLSYLMESAKSKYGIVKGLNELYNKCIQPHQIDFSLLISKNHQFYINKHKLEKVFGIFELVHTHKDLEPSLRQNLQNLIKGNQLGPIAFVTPEIGSWSSIGGLGVMVDELSKELARLGEEVYIITPYYEYNKKKETNYLWKDGFTFNRNIRSWVAHFEYEFGIHTGKYCGVNYVWFHNSELFCRPYDGEGALYITKQLVFFALVTLECFCQLKIIPSLVVTNDWMCGFVSAYVKHKGYDGVFKDTKFMHIVHNLDPLYEGRLYPIVQEGILDWLVCLPPQWYTEYTSSKVIINPSKCALQTCDNWGTVSNSYKIELLKESDLAGILWKHPHPFSFPNGIRKDQRTSILRTKTPGNHLDSKRLLQQKYFKCAQLKNDVPLLAFIGRVTRQKGVHLILDAAQSLFFEYGYNVQILVGGMSDAREEYGKYCSQKMKYLTNKYPHCFWSNPDQFFTDGPLVNIGSDFAIMPSMFEPGGIVQHEFFCGGTPVITFCTGGLKDTVFEFDQKSLKGNGFNFLNYDLEDFKRCMRRALDCYFKNRPAYEKLRQNAVDSVVEEEDVARGWNNEFYRMQNKIYIDKPKVQEEIQRFKATEDLSETENIALFDYKPAEYWKPSWEVVRIFKEVLQSASRLKGKLHTFTYQTKKIPRPKEVFVIGSWDNWESKNKLTFDKIMKNYKLALKLEPGTYSYKYMVEGQWELSPKEQIEDDNHGNINHQVTIQ